VSGLWPDFRLAARSLRHTPGYTILAVLVLAVGVGAAGATYALLDAVLVRPLPFADPSRLAMLWEHSPTNPRNSVSPLNFLDWSEQNHTFSGMAALAGGSYTLTDAGTPAEQLAGQAVTSSFFDVLGVRPIAGRTFVRADAAAAGRVIIVSERLWRRRFGADPVLVGRTLRLDRQSYTVIGIVPARFQILFPSDIWTLFVPRRSPEQREEHYMRVIGRLRPGADLEQARTDMRTVAADLARAWPGTNKDWSVTVDPLRRALVPDVLRATSLMLGGIVLFVLLMSCANVAGLAIARGIGRTREMAVRAALGASRARIVRQLLAENLLLGAGLLLRTLARLDAVDTGFHADRVLTMHVTLPFSRYRSEAARLAFYRAVEREVAPLPGVRMMSFGGSLPLDGWDFGQGFRIVGAAARAGEHLPPVHYQIVGRRYFEALGIPLLRGRAFTEDDAPASQPVCIVNREFARRYLQDRDPIGALVSVDAMEDRGPTPIVRRVVGVSGQVKVEGPAEAENAIEIYVPIAQNPWYGASIVVRTAGAPLAMAPSVEAAIARVDKDQGVSRVRTMDQVAAEAVAMPRFRAELVALFAGIALVLAAVGVFGVLTFAVGRRTREFGIRAALGASPVDVSRLVVRDGLTIAVAGAPIGLLASVALTRSLSSLLFGVTPLDPVTLFAAPSVLILTAVAACARPAVLAMRIDPAVALRGE
jgi:hypothetical protein